MNKYMKTFVAATAVTLASLAPAQAAGGLSCEELDDAIDQLADLLDELDTRSSVIVDSAYDFHLRNAAEIAMDFANAEGNSNLRSYARGMMRGWDTEDAVRYTANGDEMIRIYKQLYRRDC